LLATGAEDILDSPTTGGFDIQRLLLVAGLEAGSGLHHAEALSMAASVKKHSITIRGHRTSVSLEALFWDMLKEKAAREGRSLSQLVAEVDEATDGNLSSALRLHVVEWLHNRLKKQESAS